MDNGYRIMGTDQVFFSSCRSLETRPKKILEFVSSGDEKDLLLGVNLITPIASTLWFWVGGVEPMCRTHLLCFRPRDRTAASRGKRVPPPHRGNLRLRGKVSHGRRRDRAHLFLAM